MNVTRLYTGSDGKSHFEDIVIPLNEFGTGERLSELVEATGIVFRETSADLKMDWHRAPRRLDLPRFEPAHRDRLLALLERLLHVDA